MKRDTRTAYRARAAATERSVDAALAEVKAAKATEAAERAVTHAERGKPVPFTQDELKAARAVRDAYGWHKVARVNAKTVSVETGYSWTDRIEITKILQVAT
jgi:hypothetical protein